MMNKRGAELAISTLVIIVIAVVVLVVLVVGFTTGWGNLWGNIQAFFGGGSNVDAMVRACDTACLTQSKNAWCAEERTVTGFTGKKTCEQLKAESTKGFKDCPGITC